MLGSRKRNLTKQKSEEKTKIKWKRVHNRFFFFAIIKAKQKKIRE
jgi:hypothetical protein